VKAVRKTCPSNDGGVTWSKVEDAAELRDPGCMASVFRYTDAADGAKSRILFSGSQSTKREKGPKAKTAWRRASEWVSDRAFDLLSMRWRIEPWLPEWSQSSGRRRVSAAPPVSR
jgi:hypothetical protein